MVQASSCWQLAFVLLHLKHTFKAFATAKINSLLPTGLNLFNAGSSVGQSSLVNHDQIICGLFEVNFEPSNSRKILQ